MQVPRGPPGGAPGPQGLSPRQRRSLCPTHFIAAGFTSQEKRNKFESLKSHFNKYWVPCVLFTNLAAQARRDGRIRDDMALCLLLKVSQLRIRHICFPSPSVANWNNNFSA